MARKAVVCRWERQMPESAALTDNDAGECCCCCGWSLPGDALLSVITICILSRALFISSTITSRFVWAELHSTCLNNVYTAQRQHIKCNIAHLFAAENPHLFISDQICRPILCNKTVSHPAHLFSHTIVSSVCLTQTSFFIFWQFYTSKNAINAINT